MVTDNRTLPRVVTVILNTDRRHDTLECLASVVSNGYPNATVVGLDNQSSDGSAEAIRDACPSVEVMELTEKLSRVLSMPVRAAMAR